MRTLTVGELNRATLARQLLLERAEITAAEAVARLCGMQAQEPKPPFLGLWSRIRGFDAGELHTALHERRIVRATLMRGTLHLMTAADFAALRTSLQPMLDNGWRAILRDRSAGLDIGKLLPVAREILAEGPLTFNELRPRLLAEFPDVNERALGYAVRMALPLVMVPTADRWAFPRTASFTLAGTWLSEPISPDDAVEELALRYLAAFGPASAADAQTWSGLATMKDALERLRPRLEVFTDDRGRELYDLPDAPRPDADTPVPPRFLPEFDNLVLAHADRRRVIADEHRPAIATKNLRIKATFLWNGFAAGTWEVKATRRTATMRLIPFEPLPGDALGSLTTEAESLLRFTEPDTPNTAVDVVT